MKILTNGQATENSWPGRSQDQPYVISNDFLVNYKLTVDGATELSGVNTLVASALTVNYGVTVVNSGTLHLQKNSSFVDQTDLRGTGTITANKSSVTIAGPSQTSETISLVNHSNLYLGVAPEIAFLAPITMDKTSTIHLTNQPSTWASIFSSNGWAHMHPNAPADFIGDMATVHSTTPGYRPEIEFQFGGPQNMNVVGVIIVDKPIAAAHS